MPYENDLYVSGQKICIKCGHHRDECTCRLCACGCGNTLADGESLCAEFLENCKKNKLSWEKRLNNWWPTE